MRPGRLPAEYHAHDANRRRRFSMSFAIALILGPAIFLGILAYEGALADEPAPFDDDPAHHHRHITPSGPFRFCTYLDEENHIQVETGPCKDNNTQYSHHKQSVGLLRDFCIEKMSNETFDIVNCSESITSPLAIRQLHYPSDLCLYRNSSTRFVVISCDGHEDFRIHGRSQISPDIACYNARPGGWWEPCPEPEVAKHTRDTPTKADELCLYFELDGSTTAIYNTTCSNAHSADQPPENCNECDNISLDHEIDKFKCYVQAGSVDYEIVRCPDNTKQLKSDLIKSYQPLQWHLLDRATLLGPRMSSPPLAETPEKWKGTERCTKDICRWVNITGEIKNRCYAKDDSDPKTPPTPDAALKYTAPFECNVCLEDGKYHEDKEHILRHCKEVVMKEDLVTKILVGVVGGLLVIGVIWGIYWEHRKGNRLVKNPFPELDPMKGRFRERSKRTPVLPPFDGSVDVRMSMFSLTTSQQDAPAIHIKSRSHSSESKEAANPEIGIIPVPQPTALAAGEDPRPTPQPPVPARGDNTSSPPQSLRLEAAGKTSSPFSSLSSEISQTMCRRIVCKDCSSSMSGHEVDNHKCSRVECRDCNHRIRESQSEDHPCSQSSSRVASERQPVMQPAKFRSTDDV